MFRVFLFAAVFLFGFTTMNEIVSDFVDPKSLSIWMTALIVLFMGLVVSTVAVFTVKNSDDITPMTHEKLATEKLKSLVPNGFSDLGQGRYIHVYDYTTGEWSIQKVTNTDYACTIRFPSRKSAQAALEIMGDQMNDLLYGQ